MVLIKVDFPRPVWPKRDQARSEYRSVWTRWKVKGTEEDEQEREFDIPTQMTLNWKPRFKSLRSIWEVMLSKPTWLLGKMVLGPMFAILKEGSDFGR